MENDQTPIRADISLSVHPDALLNVAKELNVEGTPGQAIYKTARQAIAPLYEALGAMTDARKALYANVPPNAPMVMGRADPKTGEGGHMIPITGREGELRNAMNAAFDRAARISDHQYKTLMAMREDLAKSIDAKLTYKQANTPLGIAQAGEIRSMVRSMSKKDRSDYVEQILDEGDLQQISALLHAPGRHTTGLSKVEHEQLRKFAAQKLATVEHKQLLASDEAINTIMRAGMAFHSNHQQLQPPGPKEDPNGLDGALNKLRTGKAA